MPATEQRENTIKFSAKRISLETLQALEKGSVKASMKKMHVYEWRNKIPHG
jgi:hypothetical protein